ncbi:hypothetical protein ACLOJK_007328 [Asimina triloba]
MIFIGVQCCHRFQWEQRASCGMGELLALHSTVFTGAACFMWDGGVVHHVDPSRSQPDSPRMARCSPLAADSPGPLPHHLALASHCQLADACACLPAARCHPADPRRPQPSRPLATRKPALARPSAAACSRPPAVVCQQPTVFLLLQSSFGVVSAIVDPHLKL